MEGQIGWRDRHNGEIDRVERPVGWTEGMEGGQSG